MASHRKRRGLRPDCSRTLAPLNPQLMLAPCWDFDIRYAAVTIMPRKPSALSLH